MPLQIDQSVSIDMAAMTFRYRFPAILGILYVLLLPSVSAFLAADLKRHSQRQCPATIDSSASLPRIPLHATKASTIQHEREARREELFNLLEATPSNAPTSPDFTNYILDVVKRLEKVCPTPDQDVIGKLGGTWELLWTAQDKSSNEYNPLFSWMNPLEDQSYSNNPDGAEGRLNPVLPRAVQDQLERLGIIRIDSDVTNVKSTQSIDVQNLRVRNVVAFAIPDFPDASKTRRASMTVDIDITADSNNARRVNVKFQACRVVIPNSPIDINFPLGLLGPTGWLVTNYIDDDIRITRGHKGSVFVLKRPTPRRTAEV